MDEIACGTATSFQCDRIEMDEFFFVLFCYFGRQLKNCVSNNLSMANGQWNQKIAFKSCEMALAKVVFVIHNIQLVKDPLQFGRFRDMKIGFRWADFNWSEPLWSGYFKWKTMLFVSIQLSGVCLHLIRFQVGFCVRCGQKCRDEKKQNERLVK